jgi:hypothetical protein
MGALRKVAEVVLTITLGVFATIYDGTGVRVILWTLTVMAGAVLLIDAANTETAQARLPWLARLPLVRKRPSETSVGRPSVTSPLSLALQLRQEADKLSDLRSRLRSDPLGRTVTGPPPQYSAKLDLTKQRIVSLLRGKYERLAHEFLAEIPPNRLAAFIGRESEADRLDRVVKVYAERLGTIIERLTAGESRDEQGGLTLFERLMEEFRRGDEMAQHFLDQMYSTDATAETVWGPIDDALSWARRVEGILRVEAPEWLPDFRMAGYEIPPEPEPADVTVADVEAMLSARVRLLGQIIRDLRSEERA